ncbi:MAG TPA: hypothetical protein VGM33_26215 [Baekduia sp.]
MTAVPSVPAALREAVGAWRAEGRPPQGAVPYVRERWIAALPEHAATLRALPGDGLDRAAAHAAVAASLAAGELLGAFVVSQVWGYGRSGYGPFRVRRILDQPEADLHVRASYDELCDDGPVAGFAAFSGEHRLRGLGPAFFTKFMYLADPSRRALVLDEYVLTWLRERAEVKLSRNPRPADYERYLQIVGGWAAELDVPDEAVERLIFTAEAMTRPRSTW